VKAGNGSTRHLLYCGRYLGQAAIPGSDGQCGPNNGPQCPDCRGMTVGSTSGAGMVLTASTIQQVSAPLSSLFILIFLVSFCCFVCCFVTYDFMIQAMNRAGVLVRAGSGSTNNLVYCGRRLGREIIPGSDGQCGPNNGPQCPDCRGMTVTTDSATTSIPLTLSSLQVYRYPLALRVKRVIVHSALVMIILVLGSEQGWGTR
jgi:hypothetical protein